MTKRKKRSITVISIVFIILLVVGVYAYYRHHQIQASENDKMITDYTGTVNWSDGTPAAGVIVALAGRQAIVQTDGSYFVYLMRTDFNTAIVNANTNAINPSDGAEISFTNPISLTTYPEVGQFASTSLPMPTTYGTSYQSRDFVIQKPAVNNFTLATNSPSVLNKVVTFKFNFINPTNVSINIKSGSQVIKTLSQEFVDGGSGTMTWDEKGSGNNIVANGAYTADISAIDGANPAATLSGIPIIVLNLGPNSFVLNGNPVPNGHTVTFNYKFSNPTTITFNVTGSNGSKVKTITQSFPAGSGSMTWDGKDSLGRPTARGNYNFQSIGDDHSNLPTIITRLINM